MTIATKSTRSAERANLLRATSTLPRVVLSAFVVAGLMGTPVQALVIPNPDPATFAGDAGGAGVFTTNGVVVAIESLDRPAEDLGLGTEFGFFFLGDPATLIPIFDPADQADPQQAIVDFSAGEVFDSDDPANPTLQGTFTTSLDPIGFYVTLDPALVPAFGVSTIFSVPGLNPGGEDMMGIFPALAPANPFSVLAFAVVNPDDGQTLVLAQEAVSANNERLGVIVDGPTVPEPATLLLFLPGMLLVVGRSQFARRRCRQS